MHPQPTADAWIPLRRRDGTIRAWTVIDADDERRVNQWRWCLSDGYAVCQQTAFTGPRRLHRFLLVLAPGDPREGDHIDLDRLNNRRMNLRIATRKQNGQNVPPIGGTSEHRGVSWHEHSQTWRARAKLHGREHSLGYFRRQEDADRAAAQWRREHMPFSEADHRAPPAAS